MTETLALAMKNVSTMDRDTCVLLQCIIKDDKLLFWAAPNLNTDVVQMRGHQQLGGTTLAVIAGQVATVAVLMV